MTVAALATFASGGGGDGTGESLRPLIISEVPPVLTALDEGQPKVGRVSIRDAASLTAAPAELGAELIAPRRLARIVLGEEAGGSRPPG